MLGALPLIAIANIVTELLSPPDVTGDYFNQMSMSPWALWVMALIGPLAEEVCFRYGILGSLLERKVSPWPAIIASALIFSLVHMNPAQMVGAAILGLYFGWLYARSQSLWPSAACHMLNNAMAVMLLRYTTEDDTISELLPAPWLVWVVLALSLAVFLLIMLPLRSRFE